MSHRVPLAGREFEVIVGHVVCRALLQRGFAEPSTIVTSASVGVTHGARLRGGVTSPSCIGYGGPPVCCRGFRFLGGRP
eukprot:4716090-Lingulodinium_polyedra.AAC.1